MSRNPPNPEAAKLIAHAEFLRRVARRLVRDPDRADDLVQDTCVAALESDRPSRGQFAGWLAGIARNLARMSARSEIRRKQRERVHHSVRASPEPAETAARLETQERLLRAVRALPEPCRGTLVSRYFDGLSAAAIARRSNVPASTVRTRVERALRILRERLDRESGGDRRAWIGALVPIALPIKGAFTTFGTGTAGVLAKGAMIVTAKKAIVTAVVVLLVAALGTLAFSPGHSPDAPPPRNTDATLPPPTGGPDSNEVAGEPTPQEGVAYPPPVDLDAADRDLDLHGRVVDVKHRPIPGASVETVRRPWRRSSVLNATGYDETESGPRTRSSSDGSFLLRLRRADLVDLRITAEGYAETTIPWCQAGERLLVVLTAGAQVEVICRDVSGSAVAGVLLTLWRNPSLAGPVLRREGRTDDTGRHVFEGLTGGECYLRLEHAVLGSPGWERPVVPVSGRLTVEVTIPTGRTITGRVTDGETGAPIAGAKVGANWVVGRAVETGSDGRYTFPGWTGKGARDLHVIAEGYGRRKQTVPAEGEVDFILSHGDIAIGRILGRNGEPVAGALVTALAHVREPTASRNDSRLDSVSLRTSKDGRFRLKSLQRDIGPHTLVVQAIGHAKLLHDFAPCASEPGEIDLGDLVLGEARRLEGRVVDGDGNPVVGARIGLRLEEKHAIPDLYGGREERRTDDLGRFRFPDLAAGRYVLTVIEPGYPTMQKEAEIPPDRDLLDLEFRRTDGRRLTVRVLDPDGKPLAGVFVGSQTVGGVSVSGRTGDDGRAMLEGLPAREFQLYVHVASVDLLPFPGARVPPGETELTVRLEKASLVRGVVLDPDGKPVPSVYVFVRDAAGERLPSLGSTDREGEFTLKLSAGTTVDLRVTGQSAAGSGLDTFAPLQGEVRGVTAPRNGVVIRTEGVEGGRSITVLVRDTEGRPLSGSQVALSVREKHERKTTGADGTVEFTGLPAAEARIWAFPPRPSSLPENAVNPKEAAVVPHGQQVELRFRVGTILRGIVRGPDGEPISGATVSVMTDEGVSQDRVTDAGGRFRCPAQPGLTHRVWANGRDAEGNPVSGHLGEVRPEDGEVEIEVTRGSR